jgi:uncharacterized protein YqgC (DUF456 family)
LWSELRPAPVKAPQAGAVVGAVIGFFVALLACGVLALLIEIRSELIKIHEALERGHNQVT